MKLEFKTDLRAVIFDFDGPINDSFREGLRRIEVLCGINKIGFDREKRQQLIKLWGKPGVVLLQESLGISKELAETIYPQWEVWDFIQPISLIPGARETLRWNRKNKIVNALLTSRNKKNVTDIFEKLDLTEEFTVISTRQDSDFRKPDPRVFDFVMNELNQHGIEKDGCIFIGDTPEDITCGQEAEIETLVVMTGPYWLEHILRYPVKPQNILPSVDYLPEWIEKYSRA